MRADVDKPQEAVAWSDRAIRTFHEVLRREPRHVEARRQLCLAHWNRANGLSRLGRFAEAFQDWDRAQELDPGRYRTSLALGRATTLAFQGDHAQAVAAATAAAAADETSGGMPPISALDLAWVYAVSVPAVRKDLQLSEMERDKLAEQYGARAVELLRKAHAAQAFRTPHLRERVRKGADLAPLRSRSDFQKLLADLEKQP